MISTVTEEQKKTIRQKAGKLATSCFMEEVSITMRKNLVLLPGLLNLNQGENVQSIDNFFKIKAGCHLASVARIMVLP